MHRTSLDTSRTYQEQEMPKTVLTTKQKEIFDFVVDYWSENGWGPNTSDVQRKFEFRSHASARDHLFAIASKGYIEFSPTAVYPSGLQGRIKETAESFRSINR